MAFVGTREQYRDLFDLVSMRLHSIGDYSDGNEVQLVTDTEDLLNLLFEEGWEISKP